MLGAAKDTPQQARLHASHQPPRGAQQGDAFSKQDALMLAGRQTINHILASASHDATHTQRNTSLNQSPRSCAHNPAMQAYKKGSYVAHVSRCT